MQPGRAGLRGVEHREPDGVQRGGEVEPVETGRSDEPVVDERRRGGHPDQHPVDRLVEPGQRAQEVAPAPVRTRGTTPVPAASAALGSGPASDRRTASTRRLLVVAAGQRRVDGVARRPRQRQLGGRHGDLLRDDQPCLGARAAAPGRWPPGRPAGTPRPPSRRTCDRLAQDVAGATRRRPSPRPVRKPPRCASGMISPAAPLPVAGTAGCSVGVEQRREGRRELRGDRRPRARAACAAAPRQPPAPCAGPATARCRPRGRASGRPGTPAGRAAPTARPAWLPMPVLTPYTGLPAASAASVAAREPASRSSSAGVSVTGSPSATADDRRGVEVGGGRRRDGHRYRSIVPTSAASARCRIRWAPRRRGWTGRGARAGSARQGSRGPGLRR